MQKLHTNWVKYSWISQKEGQFYPLPSPPLKEAVLQNINDYDESFIIYKKNFISL